LGERDLPPLHRHGLRRVQGQRRRSRGEPRRAAVLDPGEERQRALRTPGAAVTRPILDAPASPAEATEIIADASLALAFGGLRDLVWGHASVRDPDGRGLWTKAAGWGFEEIG